MLNVPLAMLGTPTNDEAELITFPDISYVVKLLPSGKTVA